MIDLLKTENSVEIEENILNQLSLAESKYEGKLTFFEYYVRIWCFYNNAARFKTNSEKWSQSGYYFELQRAFKMIHQVIEIMTKSKNCNNSENHII